MKGRGKKTLIHPITHLQHIFIACCVCRPFTLWPHFFPSAKYTHQVTGGNSSRFLMVLTAPRFFLSCSCSLGTLFLLLLCPPPHLYIHHCPAHTPYFPPPPSTLSLFHPLSLSPRSLPIPLSQLPVELAAFQDLADGSVIRSASLHSLFFSPLFFLSFSLSLIKLQKKTSVHWVLNFADSFFACFFSKNDGTGHWFFCTHQP